MFSIVMWPGSADDEYMCLNVNIGLWPQDVLASVAQESQEELREPKSAQERRREPKRAIFYGASSLYKSHECVNGALVRIRPCSMRMPSSMVRKAMFI